MHETTKRRVIARTVPLRRGWKVVRGLASVAAVACVGAAAWSQTTNGRIALGVAAVICVLLAWFSHRVLCEIRNFKDFVRTGKLN